MNKIRRAMELALGKLPTHVMDALVEAITVRFYEAGSVICYEGELEPIFYIIEQGSVAFTKKIDNGDQFLGIKTTGEFFGELGVLDQAPRAATVHAVSDCNLIEMHQETLEEILEHSPSVARSIMHGIIRSVRDTDQITIAELQLKNSELARTLENLKLAQAELLVRERQKRDLEIAATVHKSILPTSFPDIPGFEFAAIARPAREIGGDMYDVMKISDNHIGIVMADASGKSVQAAIYMAVVRTSFLSQTQAPATLSPSETAHRVHDLLMRVSTADMFVTAFYATINCETRHMRYIRGGHDRPVYHKAATNNVELLDAPGRFLGLLPNLLVEEEDLTFEVGDVLVCYSDGVTDATGPTGEMYGLERLEEIVRRGNNQSAQELVEFITHDIDTFRGDTEQPDDLTLLIIKAVDK